MLTQKVLQAILCFTFLHIDAAQQLIFQLLKRVTLIVAAKQKSEFCMSSILLSLRVAL